MSIYVISTECLWSLEIRRNDINFKWYLANHNSIIKHLCMMIKYYKGALECDKIDNVLGKRLNSFFPSCFLFFRMNSDENFSFPS